MTPFSSTEVSFFTDASIAIRVIVTSSMFIAVILTTEIDGGCGQSSCSCGYFRSIGDKSLQRFSIFLAKWTKYNDKFVSMFVSKFNETCDVLHQEPCVVLIFESIQWWKTPRPIIDATRIGIATYISQMLRWNHLVYASSCLFIDSKKYDVEKSSVFCQVPSSISMQWLIFFIVIGLSSMLVGC